MIASLLIGIIQTFAVAVDYSLADLVALFRSEAAPAGDLFDITLAQVAPILPYLLLVLVLIFRPRGIMGARES